MPKGGEDLYEAHARGVYRFLFSLCREADTAEELTQETFSQALKNLDSFRGDCAPLSWLCAIAKRLWYKELSRRKRTVSLEEVQLPPLPDGGDPAAETERRSEKLQLYQAMQRLPQETREVLYLRLSGDLSFREIGAILGRSEVWARVRFYRGKEELTRILGGDENGGA